MSEEYWVVVGVEDGGQTIKLEAGSTWQIAVGDDTRSLPWCETQRVVIEKNDDESYPYRLRNVDTSESVLARCGSSGDELQNIVSGCVRDIGSIKTVPNSIDLNSAENVPIAEFDHVIFKPRFIEWISVRKLIPEEQMMVLVSPSEGDVTTGFLCDGEWNLQLLPWFHEDNVEVTHWAPLPAPAYECSSESVEDRS